MKIKEVEKASGISINNIRYYEKEGLLHSERNSSNNYRQYTEEDVMLLKHIKILMAVHGNTKSWRRDGRTFR